MPDKTEMWTNFYRNVIFHTPVWMMDIPGVVSSRFTGSWTRARRTRAVGARVMGVSVIGVRQLAAWAPLRNPVRIRGL